MKHSLSLSPMAQACSASSWHSFLRQTLVLLGLLLAAGPGWAQPATLADGGEAADPNQATAFHRLVLCTDGSVMGWGMNNSGQLGTLGNPVAAPTILPATFPAPLIRVITSHSASFALDANGNVWAWGGNYHGQLGIGSGISSTPTPTQIVGLSNIVSIAGGHTHTLALRADGTVWTWGNNDFGQLGNGTTSNTPQYTPQQVAPTQLTTIRAISCGDHYSLALTAAGQLYVWGMNDSGALGTGAPSNTYQTTPVLINGLTNVLQVDATERNTAALTTSGAVYVWGYNQQGELGLGHSNYTGTPALVGTFAGAASVTVASGTTIVVRGDGSRVHWGFNDLGQFGTGSATPTFEPLPVAGPAFSPNIQLSGTNAQFMSIDRTGNVKTWGYGQTGLGYTPTTPGVNGGSCVPTTPTGVCLAVPQVASFPACGLQRAYFQRPGATYEAYRHNNPQSPAEIGMYGTTTIIDASQAPYNQAPYNNTVTFSGVYHLRGNVRFINGNFVLAAGTVFYVDGLSGYGGAGANTVLEAKDATLRLTNATLQAACSNKWEGIRLVSNASIYTAGSGQGQRLRSRIADANKGVAVSNTNQYYLTYTNFDNNNTGLYDDNFAKSAAQPGEGVRSCSFTDNSGYGIGIWFEPGDSFGGTFAGDYTAASFSLNTFTNLQYGIYGFASNAPVDNNHFNSSWKAGIGTYYWANSTNPMRVRNNTFTLPATLPAGQSQTTVYGLDGNNGWQLENNTFRCLSTVPNTPALRQVGAVLLGGSLLSGNTFLNLDLGLDLRVVSAVAPLITANTFSNNAEGLRFRAGQAGSPPPSLTLRCNSFSSNVTNAIGVWVQNGTAFPAVLGSASLPNGNNFSGIPVLNKRFVYDAGGTPTYFRYTSTQESFGGAGVTIYPSTGSTPAPMTVTTSSLSGVGACGTSSATPGVYARPAAAGQLGEPSPAAAKADVALRSAYPNPASETVAFAYVLPASGQAGQLVLRDLLGRPVVTTVLIGQQGEARVTVRHLPAGFYTGVLEVEGRIIATQKLSIKH